jgi:hypothetical protein
MSPKPKARTFQFLPTPRCGSEINIIFLTWAEKKMQPLAHDDIVIGLNWRFVFALTSSIASIATLGEHYFDFK